MMLSPKRNVGNRQSFMSLVHIVAVLGLSVIRVQSFITKPALSCRGIQSQRRRRLSPNNPIIQQWKVCHGGSGWWYRGDGSGSSSSIGGRRRNKGNSDHDDDPFAVNNNTTSTIPDTTKVYQNEPPISDTEIPTSSSHTSNKFGSESMKDDDDDDYVISTTSFGLSPFSIAKKSWRSSMPRSLQKRGARTFQKLENDNCVLYVLGTKHDSESSANDVTKLLKHVIPDCIILELCPDRKDCLYTTGKQWKTMSLLELLRNDPNTDVYREESGSFVGLEFLHAFQYWLERKRQRKEILSSSTTGGYDLTDYYNKFRDCTLILGDRPIQITNQRIRETLDREMNLIMLMGLTLYLTIPEHEVRIASMMDKDSDEIIGGMNTKFRQLFTIAI